MLTPSLPRVQPAASPLASSRFAARLALASTVSRPRFARLLRCALALALGLAPAAAAQLYDPDRKAQELAFELNLTEAQSDALASDLAWLDAQRESFGERIAGGEFANRAAITAERARIVDAFVARSAATLPAAAVDALPLDELFPTGPPLIRRVSLEARHTFKQGFEEGPGQLATTRVDLSANVLMPLGKDRLLFFGLGASRTRYIFRRALELDPARGDPLEVAWGGSISLGGQFPIAESVSLLVVGSAQINVEDGAPALDGLTGGGIVGGLYRINDRIALGLGVNVRTQLEDRPTVFPLPLIQLNLPIGSTSELRFGFPDGLRFAIRPIPPLEVSFGLGFGNSFGTTDIRLDDRGIAPGGVLRTTQFPLELKARWTPVGDLTLEAGLGFVLAQKLQIDDRRGRELADDRADPALSFFFGAQLSL